MRLSPGALAIASGLFWGGAVLLTGAAHRSTGTYGTRFLKGLASVYPGFHAGRSGPDVLIGGLYACVDGAVGGYLFGVVYNYLLEKVPAERRQDPGASS